MARTIEQIREAKRLHMARKRAANPDYIRAQQKAWCDANRELVRQKNRDYYNRRFFWARMTKLRGPERATHIELARLWKAQRGRCALTGAKLDRAAELDHALPKTRGGKDNIENLRWVTHEVNFAKRDLTDDEFIALCGNVMRWIGRRIEMVEQIMKDQAA
jgi:CRISPR/Cas system Type II protein with McrA/HNH and RuvC-like nuclease domain